MLDSNKNPLEWRNLASDPRWDAVIAEHAEYLPASDAAPVDGSRGLGVRPADREFFGAR